MKRFSIACGMLLGIILAVSAQTLIHIDNPEIWKCSDMNKYIGQTVRFDRQFYICNNYYYSQGNYSIAPRRIFSPTNQALPLSEEYKSIVSANNSGMVTLSGVKDYHRMGERLIGLTVKINSATQWELVDVSFDGNTREDMLQGPPSVDIRGEHTLLVCAMNLEYYLVENLGTGFGPDNRTQSERQHTKIMEALSHIPADIFGFVEIEQGQSALKKLAASLTELTGRQYSWVDDGGSPSGSFTKSGYVYCIETVKPDGSLRNNNTVVQNRKKMMCFEEISSGERFIFSLNHFKAKSGTGTGLDADQKDGQGIYNNSRKKEAESVLSDYNNNMSYYKDNDILIMGDLNAYAKEDPIQILTNGGMTDLHRYFHADSSYSYVYREQAGYLDHALANSTMLEQITGMAAYHINSDEHDYFTYDKSSQDLTMFRCSDHDPILVGLQLGFVPTIEPDIDIDINIEDMTATISQAQGGYYRIYNINGNLITEGNITNERETIDMNLPAGLYLFNIYAKGTLKTFKVIF